MEFYKCDKVKIVAATDADTINVWEAEMKAEPQMMYKKYSDDGKNHAQVWLRYCGLKRQGDVQPTIYKVCVQTNKLFAGLHPYKNAFYSFETKADATAKYNSLVAELEAKTIPDEPKVIEAEIGG